MSGAESFQGQYLWISASLLTKMMENKFWSKTCRLPFFNTEIFNKTFLQIIYPKEALKILCYRSILIRTKNTSVKNQPYNGKAVQIPMLLGNNYKTLFLVIGLCRRGKYCWVVPADHFHNKIQECKCCVENSNWFSTQLVMCILISRLPE